MSLKGDKKINSLLTKSGVALMVTLWVLVLLSALALNFSLSTRQGSAGARNFKEETIAYYQAISAYENALSYLFQDKDLSVDFTDEAGDFWADIERDPVTGTSTVDGVEVTVSITDEESRLNINKLTPVQWRLMLEPLGMETDELDELIDAILDWRDPDDLERINGAETDYYEDLEPGYPSRDGPFETVEELLLVKGFKPGYLKSIGHLLTTHGQGLNANTVGGEMLTVLGVDQAVQDTILAMRTQELGGMRIVEPGLAAIGVNLTQSYNFRITVRARVLQSPYGMKITAIARKFVRPEGVELKTVYWREGIDRRR